jgi:DNA primase
MALYTKDSIDRVKEAVDMHGLVSERTDLKRVGSRWTGLCPFHDERTPSFSVDVEQKLYHCFGCGQSGDAIRFVQETEGVDFREAIERLSERTRVELVREASDPEEEKRRAQTDRLRALLTRAGQFYAAYLWKAAEAEPARKYLAERGLDQAVLEEFQVGYAPSAGDKLIQQAAKSGFSAQDLVTAGLARRREGRVEDAFRGRIIFPLADHRGRILGFAGRALREGQQPKYLNTSENKAVGFHKGQLLYGMHKARTPAMKTGRFVVVEGYTDVLALHQAGVPECVAIMGTSLTDPQLEELTRVQGTVYLALDADNAGKQATFRAAGMAADRNTELRVIAMPGGRDPAEIVTQDGAGAFRSLIDSALSVPEFQVRRVLEQSDLSSAPGRDRAMNEVLPVIQSAPPIMSNELVRIASDQLGIDPQTLKAELGAPRRRPAASGTLGTTGAAVSRPARPMSPVSQVERSERVFLSLCLGLGERGSAYLERSRPEHFATEIMRRARQHLLTHTGDPLADLTPAEQDLASAVMEIVKLADEGPVAEQALQLSYLQLELRRVERDLRTAEQRSDFERQRHLWGERESVRGEISDLMGQTA